MKRILFICTGNTCRSPMAEGFFNKLAEEAGLCVRASSAGLYADDGQPAAENAIVAASEFGADISTHRAKTLTEHMLNKDDLIFTMTGAQAKTLAAVYPGVNIETLADGDISDPFGGDMRVYIHAAGEIYTAIEQLLNRFKGDTEAEGLIIREMTKDDLKKVAEMEKLCFAVPWNEAMLEEDLNNPHSIYLLAEREGRLMGYCGAHFILDEGHITNVATAPEFRRTGIAKQLLNELERRAREEGISFLTLEVRASNQPAIALYAGLGYEYAGKRPGYYTMPCEDALLMTHKLK